MSYLLALDSGTSSARAIVFDRQGRQHGLGRRNFAQHYPQPGWVEHDAEEIWQAQLAATQEALNQSGITAQEVSAIGITNQRETTVLWDRQTGVPVHRAIVWQDRRTAERCQQLLNTGHGTTLRQKTGLVPDPYFSATKIQWILENIPSAERLAETGRLAFGTIDTWLLWKLTGGRVHATDVSNASRTLLFNLNTLSWDEELLNLFGIPSSILPEVRPSSANFGLTEAELLGKPIHIGGVAGDQQAATFGQVCLRPGMVKNTYGTGCFMLMNTGNQPVPSQKLITTIGWQVGSQITYALEGAVFSAGASLGWLQEVGLIESPAQAEELAKTLETNEGVYFVPAFAGLGAPQWDPTARGTLLGLTRGSGRAHLSRAALEAMAFQSDEVLQAMQAESGLAIPTLRVDGGASASDLLMQFQADLSGIRIERPANLETTALGAALLAGLHAGVFNGLEELEAFRQTERVFSPAFTAEHRARLRADWKKAVARAMGWAV